MRSILKEQRHWLLFALGLAVAALWTAFCFNSEIDRTETLVLSRLFVGRAVSIWLFLGVGVALFVLAVALLGGAAREFEMERDMYKYGSDKHRKLGNRNVIVGLILFVALIFMILGALNVIMSSGSDPRTPGTLYYYYYY